VTYILIRILAAMAGLLAIADAAQASPSMSLGGPAMPPQPYVDFCERQPLDCGSDAAAVLAGAAQAQAQRAELLGQPVKVAQTAAVAAAPAALAGPIALTPALWAKLNEANARVNRALRPRSDADNYGVEDYWATPLADHRGFGDCEDYVLEKVRALVAAGVPRSALDIALVTTRWGENHAVLVVTTADGDFVLDSLNPLVKRWDCIDYRFHARQVAGQAFVWARVAHGSAPGVTAALAR
jgi:predicted transglutaminase-like cysteine proteinase